jgi:guanine deaminase
MREALRLAALSVRRGGGPFGAVVVKGGKIVGRGHNRVTLDNDPSSHAEVVAVRDACRRLKTFSLDGCAIYASCEPCPMCLSTALWARAERVFFAADRRDAARAGFDDAVFYRELRMRPAGKRLPVRRLVVPGAAAPFALWRAKTDRTPY